eukprot:scaffold4178_cov257-Pinguiococcus_pyrenoidosus.AAC.6
MLSRGTGDSTPSSSSSSSSTSSTPSTPSTRGGLDRGASTSRVASSTTPAFSSAAFLLRGAASMRSVGRASGGGGREKVPPAPPLVLAVPGLVICSDRAALPEVRLAPACVAVAAAAAAVAAVATSGAASGSASAGRTGGESSAGGATCVQAVRSCMPGSRAYASTTYTCLVEEAGHGRSPLFHETHKSTQGAAGREHSAEVVQG